MRAPAILRRRVFAIAVALPIPLASASALLACGAAQSAAVATSTTRPTTTWSRATPPISRTADDWIAAGFADGRPPCAPSGEPPSASPEGGCTPAETSISVAPSASARPAEFTPRLPPEVVRKVIRDAFPTARKCYEQLLRRYDDAHGAVTARFIIARDGHVTRARIEHDEIGDTEMARCTRAVFLGLVFPPPEGGLVVVIYPIDFQPQD